MPRFIMMGMIGIGLMASSLGTTGAELPVAKTIRAAQPPKLDGILNEVCWKDAPAQGDFYLFTGGGQRSRDTEFKLAYDDAWLYIGVDCRNKDMKAIQPKIKGHDQGAFQDDSVEFFLDPGTGGRVYFHYMLGFANARDERRVTDRNREIEWDEAWRSATHIREDGWSAEIAIPLYIAASYGPFETWRLNVTRNQRAPTIDACGVAVTERKDLFSWAPLLREFHEPESFGRLEGITNVSLQLPFLARIENAVVQPYGQGAGRLQYSVDIKLKGQNASTGQVEVMIMDMPVVGSMTQVVSQVQLAGPDPKIIRVAVPVTATAERKITALLKDSATGEEWVRLDITDLSALNVMTAYLDRNYYTTEDQAYVVCAVGLSDLKGMVLVGRDAQNNELGRSAAVRPISKISISLDKVAVGSNPVKVELCGKDGGAIFSVNLTLIKRAPKPGCEWKIDRENRWVLNNGKPFFALGMCMYGVKPDNDEAYRRLADNHFNTFLVWERADAEGQAAYQKKSAAYNLYVASLPESGAVSPLPAEVLNKYSSNVAAQVKEVITGSSINEIKGLGFLPIPLGDRNAIAVAYYENNITNLIRAIDAVKDFPSLQSYFILDEPMKEDYVGQCKIGQAFYALIQKTDGYHPVMVNYSSYIPDGDDYVNWMDILETDPYISPARQDMGTRATLNFVSKIVWKTGQRAGKNRQAVWIIPLASIWSGTRKRPINYAELRAQGYLAVIHGASGLLYFAYNGMRPGRWSVLDQLNQEIEALTPALFGPPVDVALRYKQAMAEGKGLPEYKAVEFNPDKESYPDVQVRLAKKPTGAYVLIVANSRQHPVDATFTLSGLTGKVEDLFGKKTLKTESASFRDRLEPCGTRAYKMKLTPEAGPSPITIEVALRVNPKDIPPPETTLPNNCRAGKKNLLPNPSFEDAASDGIPEYGTVSQEVGVDDTQALYGKKSLKFTRKPSGYAQALAYCAPQSKKPKTYTFSVYLKGSAEGLNAWIRGFKMNEEKPHSENKGVKLTTDWQRYSITGVIPAAYDESSGFFELRLYSEGTMWADGMQLELGDQPTAYDEEVNQESED